MGFQAIVGDFERLSIGADELDHFRTALGHDVKELRIGSTRCNQLNEGM